MIDDDEIRARRITNLRDLQDELGERAGLIEWWLGLDGDLLVEILPQPDPDDDDEFTSSDIRINVIFVDDPDRARYWFDVSRTWFEGLFPLGSLVDPPPTSVHSTISYRSSNRRKHWVTLRRVIARIPPSSSTTAVLLNAWRSHGREDQRQFDPPGI